jgi:hypothetical protein
MACFLLKRSDDGYVWGNSTISRFSLLETMYFSVAPKRISEHNTVKKTNSCIAV